MEKGAIDNIRVFLKDHAQRHGVAVFVTQDPDGYPHATWMGTVASPQLDRVLTMTSPDSRKVVNILTNPQVEWMMADEAKARILYLRGKARVLEDPEQVEAAWAALTDKSRAWFLDFQDRVGMQFVIIETGVEELEYREPRNNLVAKVRLADVADRLKAEPLSIAGLRKH